jgi:hypothetical protein
MADTKVLEMLAMIRQQLETSTAHMARVAGGIYNGVLEVSTEYFDATGDGAGTAIIQASWPVACGSVVVFNESSAIIVVTPNGGSGRTQDRGVGITVIKPGSWKAVPLASHTMAIYGTPNSGAVNYQAYTGLQAIVGGGAF